MAALRFLAVAVNSKRMGFVFFVGNQLKDWRTMTKPTQSPEDASEALEKLIEDYQPDVVVTEQVDENGSRIGSLRRALCTCAEKRKVLDVSIKRRQLFANKYEEAAWLADTYPSLKPWVPPKRRFFENEPPRMILFQATSLVHSVLKQPTLQLAGSMR